jgi:hypothetical protein
VVGKKLLFAVEPVDLTLGPAQDAHHRSTAGSSGKSCTRAAGSQPPEALGFRPHACEWESPSCRPFNRMPASQRTRL